jgi:hypothetical protein
MNSLLNSLIAKERIDDYARAAEHDRVASQLARSVGGRPGFFVFVVSLLHGGDTRKASVEPRQSAGLAHDSSSGIDARRLTIRSNTSATCHSADNITA